MCAPGFPQQGKERGNVETQPVVGKLPPSNTSQTHGNPPGLKIPPQPKKDFDEEKQNEVNRKNASLNKPKQVTADFEKAK